MGIRKEIKINRDGDGMSLALHGHLDTVTAPQLEKVLTEETEGVKMLIFDMKGLEYISSAVLQRVV